MANKITMTCEKCGGECEIVEGKDMWICPYCGTKSIIKSDIYINNFAAPAVDTGVLELLFKKGNDNVTIETAKSILASDPNNKEALDIILTCYLSKALVQCDKFIFSNYGELRKNLFALMFLTAYRKPMMRMCSEKDYNATLRTTAGLFITEYSKSVGCTDNEFMKLMTSLQFVSKMSEPESYAYINKKAFLNTHSDVPGYIKMFTERAKKCCDVVTACICVERLFLFIEDLEIVSKQESESLRRTYVDDLKKVADEARTHGNGQVVINNKTGLIWGYTVNVTVKDLIENRCLIENVPVNRMRNLTVTSRPGPVTIRVVKASDGTVITVSEAVYDKGTYNWKVEADNESIMKVSRG